MSSRAVSHKTILIFKNHLKWGQRAKNSSKLSGVWCCMASWGRPWQLEFRLNKECLLHCGLSKWEKHPANSGLRETYILSSRVTTQQKDTNQSRHRKHGRCSPFQMNCGAMCISEPSISICLSQAGRYGCLFSRYAVEWQHVGLISCCWRLRPVKGNKEKKKKKETGLGLSESRHGSCSFFAWLALCEAGYLADDKCPCTPRCLQTPADVKPWQPARLSPAEPQAFNLSSASCGTIQWQPLFAQVGSRFCPERCKQNICPVIGEVLLMRSGRWKSGRSLKHSGALG